MATMTTEYHVETLMGKKFNVTRAFAKNVQQAVNYVREQYRHDGPWAGATFVMPEGDVVIKVTKVTKTVDYNSWK